jgi:hypothetical protein
MIISASWKNTCKKKDESAKYFCDAPCQSGIKAASGKAKRQSKT